ncbi:NADP-dependent oxidoreductase [Zunongwangia sp. F363]|uniref:NADP-dependent oxidoreductase n=1 Tax=Autumnicola tepida TaxID=3075595 RepID=A0ABU3CF28_9FLAO|nr:NADP-dependent oxidoreductase [Zunongwangia sp. F363]MDT0644832.1 NADP-dependent oxidoreductase [Zunongwangia sp. F363]
MKAVILNSFGGVENFLMSTVERPTVKRNHILVRIIATSFNPVDYQIRKGSEESKLLKSAVLRRELSGVVEVVGSEVKDYSKGDEVVAYVGSFGSNGTYAEYVSIPSDLAARKPGIMRFEEAAGIPMVGLTALQIFERMNFSKDDMIFISGAAGGVGTMIIKLLLSEGHARIITIAGSKESHMHLYSLGLRQDQVINYREAGWEEKVIELNEGNLYDITIDLVGGSISEFCASVLRVHGIYCDITCLATAKARQILFDRGITIMNISNYAHALSGVSWTPDYYGSKLKFLLGLIEKGIITAPPVEIIGKLGVETVRRGHTMLEHNLAGGKKLIMHND